MVLLFWLIDDERATTAEDKDGDEAVDDLDVVDVDLDLDIVGDGLDLDIVDLDLDMDPDLNLAVGLIMVD